MFFLECKYFPNVVITWDQLFIITLNFSTIMYGNDKTKTDEIGNL